MRVVQSFETVVGAPAAAVWACYRGLEVAKLSGGLLSDLLETVEVVEGDGGVGTILKITFPPGTPGVGDGYLKEIFTIMDDERRVKETETLEGGLKAVGFDLYRFRMEVIEKDAESCIVKSSIEYELDDSKAELTSLVSPKILETLVEKIGSYVGKKKSSAN